MSFIEIPRTQKPPLGVGLDRGNLLNEGIVLEMPFNEAGGDRAQDISGEGNDGTWAGTGNHWAAGAAQFNGSNDFVDLGDIDTVTGIPGLSITAWVLTTLTASDGPQIVAKFGTGADSFNITWATSENIVFRVYTAGGPISGQFTDGIPLNGNDVWYHLAGTYDGANVKVYVNGLLGDIVSAQTGSVSVSTLPVVIGANANQDNDFWNGLIDQVSIYNRGLLAEEVQQHYINTWQRYQSILLPLGVAAAPSAFVPQVIMI